MQVQEKSSPLEEFLATQSLPENQDKRLELHHGEVIEKMAASYSSSHIGLRIGQKIMNYLDKNPIGRATGADGTYIMSEDTSFIPDVGFISKERMPDKPKGAVPMPPDLAVEVVSPSDQPRKVYQKAVRYIELGTKLVWVVFPDEETVDVYRPAEEGVNVQTLKGDASLSGGDVLPNFELTVQAIFAES